MDVLMNIINLTVAADQYKRAQKGLVYIFYVIKRDLISSIMMGSPKI